MRRPRFRNLSPRQPRIRIDEIRLTTEEILGDLFYPTSAQSRTEQDRPKARR